MLRDHELLSVLVSAGRRRTVTASCLALGWILVQSGCARPQRTYAPPVDPATLGDTAFLHYVATAPVVTVKEGTRAVLLLVGSTDQWPTFEQQVDELVRREALREDWDLAEADVLDMGTLAYMLHQLSGQSDSVNQWMASCVGYGQRRYALKAMVFAGLLPNSRPTDPVPGGVLTAALAKIEKITS